MARDGALGLLQPLVGNALDSSAEERSLLCGIIGDHPSEYAKSPAIWNAAFDALGIDAAYLPFDVTAEQLPALAAALRGLPSFAGGNVTVPHKVAVMGLLDEVDATAAQIGAVNTLRRTPDGRLLGYNTDADGVVGSLLTPAPWRPDPPLASLTGLNVLIVGAGGAGRAAAFGVAQHLDGGRLRIANRNEAAAQELAEAVSAAYGNAEAVNGAGLVEAVASADVVINASSVGQSGVRRLPGGRLTCLEGYSPLAPANPPEFTASEFADDAAFHRAWLAAARDDIAENERASARTLAAAKPHALFFDLIYSPSETAMLRQARLGGHDTVNGMGMNIIQAVEGFVNRVMAEPLAAMGLRGEDARRRVFNAMAAVW